MAKNNSDQTTVSEGTAKQLVTLLKDAPKGTALKSYELAKKPISTIQNNQILAGIFGTVGLILFAFGIENLIGTIPELSSPLVEIGLGLVFLLISGLFLKKLF